MKLQPIKSKQPNEVAYIEVDCSGNHLSMEAIGEEALKLIESQGYALVWSREGQTRTVPRFVLEDALRLYRDGQKGLKDSPLAHMLPKVHGISWAQAGLSDVDFGLDPAVENIR